MQRTRITSLRRKTIKAINSDMVNYEIIFTDDTKITVNCTSVYDAKGNYFEDNLPYTPTREMA